MREKIFEVKVKRYIEEQGGWQVKFFANKFTRAGVPDVLACIEGYFVGIEVKADNGVPTELQLKSIEQIRNAGGFAFVLYPSGFNTFKKFIDDLKHEEFNRCMPVIMK